MSKYRRKPSWVKETAGKSILRVLQLAEMNLRSDAKLSKRYVEIAIRISKKYNVDLPKNYSKRICKHCHTLMVPGYNATVRVLDGVVIWICGECGHVRRFGYVKKTGKPNKTVGENRKERTQ